MYYTFDETIEETDALPDETSEGKTSEDYFVHHPLLASMTLEEKVGQIILKYFNSEEGSTESFNSPGFKS